MEKKRSTKKAISNLNTISSLSAGKASKSVPTLQIKSGKSPKSPLVHSPTKQSPRERTLSGKQSVIPSTSPRQPIFQLSAKSKSDNNDNLPSPSLHFGTVIDNKQEIATDANIAKSTREEKDGEYHFLGPLDKKESANPQRSMLFCNVFVSFLALVTWCVCTGLVVYFILFSLRRPYYVPHDTRQDLNKVCGDRMEQKFEKFHLDPDCAYFPGIYADCKIPMTCRHVYIIAFEDVPSGSIANNMSTYEMGKLTLKWCSDNPNHQFTLPETPNFVPCADNSWCYDGQCVKTNNSFIAEYTRKSKSRDQGHWNYSCGRPKCWMFVSGPAGCSLPEIPEPSFKPDLYRQASNSSRICQPIYGNRTLRGCRDRKNKFYRHRPSEQASFAFRYCVPPRYGGNLQKCNLTSKNINLTEFVHFADNCSCNKNDAPKWCPENDCQIKPDHSCNMSCDAGKTALMPNGYACNNGGENGACFYGECIQPNKDNVPKCAVV